MNIDLSNKPDGATHYMSDEGRRNIWRMNNGAHWLAYVDGEWVLVVNATPERYIAIKAPWTGEGLPPVGMACEVSSNEGGWAKAEIKYLGERFVVYKYLPQEGYGPDHQTEISMHLTVMRFRPIRTPEQIEAEERKKVIQEMRDAALKNLQLDPFEQLYDAGYRKQVAP